MNVSGNVAGLKKGTLYLQHLNDSTLATIDSIEIKGNGNFSFQYEIESPELFYLYLEKDDNNTINDRITFFGEQGDITINTSWNNFDTKAEISGSESHKKFQEFQEVLSKFNTKELTLMQLSTTEEIRSRSEAMDSINNLADKNALRRVLYVLNFALSNTDSPVSPYVALTEASNTNSKYLDSIHNSLSDEVSNSKYGLALAAYLNEVKSN